MSRPPDALRPVSASTGFVPSAAGSCLWKQGDTLVLVTATVDGKRPRFFTDDKPGGWVTGEYVMHPASVTGGRKDWPDRISPDKRASEIGRLLGRSLRAACDLTKIGPHTITLDAVVLQADGGTRTACICAAVVALAHALRTLPDTLPADGYRPRDPSSPPPPAYDPAFYDPQNALVNPLAAVSVGVVDGQARLDLDYDLDSRADVDLNVVKTADGRYVELQGSAEQTGEKGTGFSPDQLREMLSLADRGITQLLEEQRRVT